MQVAVLVDVDDKANLDILLPKLARFCIQIDAALGESGIQADSFVQSVILSDGTVLLD